MNDSLWDMLTPEEREEFRSLQSEPIEPEIDREQRLAALNETARIRYSLMQEDPDGRKEQAFLAFLKSVFPNNWMQVREDIRQAEEDEQRGRAY